MGWRVTKLIRESLIFILACNGEGGGKFRENRWVRWVVSGCEATGTKCACVGRQRVLPLRKNAREMPENRWFAKIDGWLSDEPNTGLMGEKRCGLGRWRGLMGLALVGRSIWGG